jgi:hypothetical protein
MDSAVIGKEFHVETELTAFQRFGMSKIELAEKTSRRDSSLPDLAVGLRAPTQITTSIVMD